jgi:hypothetical protein
LAPTQIEPHLDQRQEPAPQSRVDVREIAKGYVADRVHRGAYPVKAATAGSLTWACRINSGSSGRDQLTEVGNESVGALDLLPGFFVCHADFSSASARALQRSAIFTRSSYSTASAFHRSIRS